MVIAPTTNPGRFRFTIAHELGHLLFADDQGLHLDQDIYAASKTDRSEMRANAFAAAFLMPEAVIRRRVSAKLSQVEFARLALDLAVTPSALDYRLMGLGLRDFGPDQVPSMEKAARQARDLDHYAALVELSSRPRPPRLLAQSLLRAYLDGETSIRAYAEVMGVDTEMARRDANRPVEGFEA